MRGTILRLALGAAVLLAAHGAGAQAADGAAASSKLKITTTALPNAEAGAAYAATVAATGGVKPYTFSATGLPAKLVIDPKSGRISGTPQQSAIGTATVSIKVTDAATPTPQTATVKLAMKVNALLAIVTKTLPNGEVGQAYTAQVKVSGGVPPLSYSATGLPSGLTIDKKLGTISGKPAAGTAGTASVSVTVTDSLASKPQTAKAKLSLVVAPARLAITTTALPDATLGSSYSAKVAATGGVKPYGFAATGLPTGLKIDPASGAITGTPTQTAPSTASVSVTVTDAEKPTPQRFTAKLTLAVDQSPGNEACGVLSLGANASLNGFVPFPASSPWNTDISSAPLDPNNTAITTAAGFAGLHLHPDFSSVAGGNYGIPYVVVDSSATPPVPINVIDYADQSDVARAPFPANAPIEGSPKDCDGWPDTYIGDSHVLVLDRATCFLYETFNTHRCKGAWNADSETIWDLKAVEQRPWGWTSADAAGLPILPGLIRYDEVVAGAIHHAIRFTMQVTKNDANDGYFVEPATHAAGVYWGVSNVMGMRIRLKANYDISSFSKDNQVILTAMKKYGMILADNGGYFFFQGAPDPRWNDDDLNNLKSVPSSAFEVVRMTPAWPGWDANTAPTGAAPVISSFTASHSPVASGTQVTLNWEVTGDSYDYIDKLGGVRGGSVTVIPTATTTYTLSSVNQFGRSTAQVTVTVQ
ncbi:MAG: Ig domain-containing protein [Terracidiphilus sp.]